MTIGISSITGTSFSTAATMSRVESMRSRGDNIATEPAIQDGGGRVVRACYADADVGRRKHGAWVATRHSRALACVVLGRVSGANIAGGLILVFGPVMIIGLVIAAFALGSGRASRR